MNFEVYLSEENLNAAREEGLLKKFKLTTTISTSNMHLFDPNGTIKKYDDPEQSKSTPRPSSLSNPTLTVLHDFLQSWKSFSICGWPSTRRERTFASPSIANFPFEAKKKKTFL